MIFECAPMEGVTGDLFRQAQRLHFEKADRYYTPFLSPTSSRVLAARELREVEPSHNEGIHVVPQLMGHDPDDFVWMARALRDLGYDEVNLNLGCPSGTVVTKKKGAGLLPELELLERMLDGIFDFCPVPISVKTRLGMKSPEEFYPVLELYNRYPIKELIVHPRIQTDQYQNHPNLELFAYALAHSRAPVCYNGDLFCLKDIQTFRERFPTVERIMLGRGLAANPGLIGEAKTGEKPTIGQMRAFHETLYALTKVRITDRRALLFRMKEAWRYFGCAFEGAEKPLRQIRRAQSLADYENAVNALFAACPVRDGAGFTGYNS